MIKNFVSERVKKLCYKMQHLALATFKQMKSVKWKDFKFAIYEKVYQHVTGKKEFKSLPTLVNTTPTGCPKDTI